jgi:hypothetical protein
LSGISSWRSCRRATHLGAATAETLWVHVDGTIVNRHFDTIEDIDAVVAAGCVGLEKNRDLIRGHSGLQ